MTDTDRFRELDRLFQAVCDLPSHEREARLIELAPNDELLRSEVLQLLATDRRITCRQEPCGVCSAEGVE